MQFAQAQVKSQFESVTSGSALKSSQPATYQLMAELAKSIEVANDAVGLLAEKLYPIRLQSPDLCGTGTNNPEPARSPMEYDLLNMIAGVAILRERLSSLRAEVRL